MANVADDLELPDDPASIDGAADLPYDESAAGLVRRGIQVIERRYSDSDLTIARVASEAGASREHFSRRFRARMGCSPLEHLHEVRIQNAQRLLTNSSLSIYEIGFECGYKRNSEFSAWFRRLRGSTPTGTRRGS